ncbi:helix-turn-helix domain-containing protein [Fructilactobacillus sp. Tb1]|uniref:helix-turn-helix domain-containing protein n=1 Tax=Fructilactobacillus sp. Tb1 TaxID=3422304 RepID=UPI003D2C5E59
MENKLKYYRERKGLSQEDVAKKLFVTRQTVSHWENNRNMPPLTALEDLSKLYGTTISALIGEQGAVMKKKVNFMALLGFLVFFTCVLSIILIIGLSLVFTGWTVSLSFAFSPFILIWAYFMGQGFSWFQTGISVLLVIIGIPMFWIMYFISKYIIKFLVAYFRYSFSSIFYEVKIEK